MTALAIIAAAELALIGFLVWERHRAHPDLAPLLDTVAALCQRLQAPGAAITAHDEQTRGHPPEGYAPPALEPDDDESYWLSREKLADYAMKDEIGERTGA